jgi:hypothetical protein
MDTIAKVLVLAVQYIADRNAGQSEDDDIRQLESLSASLSAASTEERQALRAAACELGLLNWSVQIGQVDAEQNAAADRGNGK